MYVHAVLKPIQCSIMEVGGGGGRGGGGRGVFWPSWETSLWYNYHELSFCTP